MNSKVFAKFLMVLAVFVAASGSVLFAVSNAAGQAPEDVQVIEFELSEDMNQFVFDEAVVFEDGMPAHGSSFITRGYIYQAGTLNGSNGVLPNGEPEFPDKVIGEFFCAGYMIGDAAHTETGPWVLSTQLYNFGETYGDLTVITEGYELADIGVPVKRAITGGTGSYDEAAGEATQTLLGFNATEGVNIQVKLQVKNGQFGSVAHSEIQQ